MKFTAKINDRLATKAKQLLQFVRNMRAANWQPYTHLCLVDESSGWSLDWDIYELKSITHRLGIRTVNRKWAAYAQKQAVFYASQFVLCNLEIYQNQNHIGLAYYHGKPGSGEQPFDDVFGALKDHHEQISRIQVSHTEMKEIILSSGIDPAKVFLIPIGINPAFFQMQTQLSKMSMRKRLGIPQSAVVVGSFQKDGVGWGEGNEPKLIKGPDVFLQTIARLKTQIPELFILLSGPARGYIKQGLHKLNVPYRHIYLKSYPEIGKLYQALDLYLVASRQEGGPKAVLESMMSGVPLVTTRVGQAMDVVRHGYNGWMVDVGDVEGLAHYARYVLDHPDAVQTVLDVGRQTAIENSYSAQLPLWREFMKGFVIS